MNQRPLEWWLENKNICRTEAWRLHQLVVVPGRWMTGILGQDVKMRCNWMVSGIDRMNDVDWTEANRLGEWMNEQTNDSSLSSRTFTLAPISLNPVNPVWPLFSGQQGATPKKKSSKVGRSVFYSLDATRMSIPCSGLLPVDSWRVGRGCCRVFLPTPTTNHRSSVAWREPSLARLMILDSDHIHTCWGWRGHGYVVQGEHFMMHFIVARFLPTTCGLRTGEW